MSGTYIEQRGQIVLTRMATSGECPHALQSQDGFVVGLLGDGFRAAVIEGTLHLSDYSGELGYELAEGTPHPT